MFAVYNLGFSQNSTTTWAKAAAAYHSIPCMTIPVSAALLNTDDQIADGRSDGGEWEEAIWRGGARRGGQPVVCASKWIGMACNLIFMSTTVDLKCLGYVVWIRCICLFRHAYHREGERGSEGENNNRSRNIAGQASSLMSTNVVASCIF